MTKKVHKYPMSYLERYHEFTFQNRDRINHSTKCGCIYCGKVFDAEDVDDYTYDGKELNTYTALCPNCGIDALIPSCVDAPVADPEFLGDMYSMYFEGEEWNCSKLPPEEVMDMFDESWSYDVYRTLVKQYLMYYELRPEYIDNEKETEERVSRFERIVMECYKEGDTPSDCGIDIAFGCG